VGHGTCLFGSISQAFGIMEDRIVGHSAPSRSSTLAACKPATRA
jgi:hypothetical protein